MDKRFIPYQKKYLKLITNDILRFNIFSNVQLLNAKNNKKINNVSFMTNLKVLNAKGECGIDQNGIVDLKL